MTATEAKFLVGRCRGVRLSWERRLGDGIAHKDIVRREHALGQIAGLDVLIAKLEGI